MRTPSVRSSLSLLAVAVAVALSGCGSSDSDPSGVPGPTTVPGTDIGVPPSSDGTPDTPDTPEPGDGEPATGAIITSDTYEDILRQVVTVANDDVLNAAADAATPLFDTVDGLVREASANGAASGNGLTFVSSEAVDDGPYSNFSFACDGGGTLVGNAYAADDVSGGPFLGEITTSDACTVDGTSYDGSALTRAIRFVRAPDERSYDAFSVTRADGGSFTLDGDYEDTTPEGNVPANDFGWTDASYTANDGDSMTRIDGYTSLRSAVYGFFVPADGESLYTAELPDGETATVGKIPQNATAKVTFAVTAPWSSGERLDVSVDLAATDSAYGFVNVSGGTSLGTSDYPLSDLGSPLVLTNLDTGEQLSIDNLPRPDATQWRTGTLTVGAADGSALVLSPETGDPATFSVAIDGESAAIVRDWSDGFQVSCPAPIVCR